MLETKLFEVRDAGTTLAAIGIACDPWAFGPGSREFQLLRRAGYGDRCILFGRLEGGKFAFDPYDHEGCARTMAAAHHHIAEHWDGLKSGDLVDVQFILGETAAPKTTDL